MDNLSKIEAVQNSVKLYKNDLWKDAEQVCLQDIDKVHQGLKNGELWSWQMIDSSTKFPNGILTGNVMDLGNYNECLGISSPVQGKHCLADISFGFAGNSSGALPLTWSYCVPKSCAAKDLQVALSQFFANAHASVTVEDSDCHDGSTRALSALDIFSISIFGLVLLCCLLSTIYDLSPWKRGTGGLYTAFSFYSNGRRLFDTSKTAETLAPLHGLRFFSMVWIILGHRVLWFSVSPVMNLNDLMQESKIIKFGPQLTTGASLAVDTFFLMSGLLNAYSLLQFLDKTKKFPLAAYYFQRYLRATPALAAFVLTQISWYDLLGDGPIWERTIGANKQLCENSLWLTLLYINNYIPLLSQCALQTWYMAVDMQLYFMAPLVIIPCWRWPKLTKCYLGLLLAISSAVQFTIAYVNKIKSPLYKLEDAVAFFRTSQILYTPTYTRATPFIMGIMLGFYLFGLRKSGRILVIPKIAVLMGWLISTTVMMSVISTQHQLLQAESSYPYDRLESSLFIGFFRIAWCCGVIWIIIACLYGYGGVVNAILSWDVLIPFSRLSYCIYLCHMAIQQYQLGTVRNTGYFQEFDIVHQFFGDIIWSIIVSTAFTLMFESPLLMIGKQMVEVLVPEGKGLGEEDDKKQK